MDLPNRRFDALDTGKNTFDTIKAPALTAISTSPPDFSSILPQFTTSKPKPNDSLPNMNNITSMMDGPLATEKSQSAPTPATPPERKERNFNKAGNGYVETDPLLQASIQRIQTDPKGAELLNLALSKGYLIRVGDPTLGGKVEVGENLMVEGNTVPADGPNGKQVVVNPKAKDFDKILVHELVHAATDDDGDSKTEEAVANVVGDQVSARVNGRAPEDPQQIIEKTFGLYPDLPDTN